MHRKSPQRTVRVTGCDPSYLGETLYRKYRRRQPRRTIIPTLDGPRLRFFHHVPVDELERAWPGERLGFTCEGVTFLSNLVPDPYVRYVLVHLYHISCFLVETAPPCQPSSWLRHASALEIELSLASVEFSKAGFDGYQTWREGTCGSSFFRQAAGDWRKARIRMDRFVRIWREAGVAPGVAWALEPVPSFGCGGGK